LKETNFFDQVMIMLLKEVQRMITLAQIKSGQRAVLTAIPSGRIRSQIIRFGLTEGAEVLCIEAIPKGPVVIERNRQQIALGQRLADQIGIELTDHAERERSA